MYLNEFDKFLQSVNLIGYREKYRPIKIVEMDLPKEIQAINLLYKVYWEKKEFLSFEAFYEEYLNEYGTNIKKFQEKNWNVWKMFQ